MLLQLAAAAGARICRGTALVDLRRGARDTWLLRVRDAAGERDIGARIVVGADGVRSRVARALRVDRSTFLPRVGLTYHIPEASPGEEHREPTEGRMVVLRGAYCGLAPVTRDRVNVGIVLAAGHRRAELAARGARATASAVLREAGVASSPDPLDAIAGIAPIAQRVSRRAGPGWLLVGDAAGFLDPFTGEGLHRALVSARLGAEAVDGALAGRSAAPGDYDAAMDRRFRSKDLVSWVVQLFVSRPALFEYAAQRLARRSAVRHRMGLLMGDLVPASGAFDPRFLGALLVP